MLDDNKIITLHPQGKKGTNISRKKYDTIRDFIVSTIKSHGEISYEKLNDLAVEKLSGRFEGKIPWYVVTVKLDLEARNIIERIPKRSPHELRLVK